MYCFQTDDASVAQSLESRAAHAICSLSGQQTKEATLLPRATAACPTNYNSSSWSPIVSSLPDYYHADGGWRESSTASVGATPADTCMFAASANDPGAADFAPHSARTFESMAVESKQPCPVIASFNLHRGVLIGGFTAGTLKRRYAPLR